MAFLLLVGVSSKVWPLICAKCVLRCLLFCGKACCDEKTADLTFLCYRFLLIMWKCFVIKNHSVNWAVHTLPPRQAPFCTRFGQRKSISTCPWLLRDSNLGILTAEASWLNLTVMTCMHLNDHHKQETHTHPRRRKSVPIMALKKIGHTPFLPPLPPGYAEANPYQWQQRSDLCESCKGFTLHHFTCTPSFYLQNECSSTYIRSIPSWLPVCGNQLLQAPLLL